MSLYADTVLQHSQEDSQDQYPDLCSTCFFDTRSSVGHTGHFEAERCVQRAIEEWQQTANSGCSVCATIVNGALQTLASIYPGEDCLQLTIEPHPVVNDYDQVFRDNGPVLKTFPIVNDPNKVVGDYRLSLRFFRGSIDFKESLVVKFFTRERTTTTPFGWGYCRPRTAGAPQAIQFAADCLKRCDSFHACYDKTTKEMPTRVLKIGKGLEPSIQVVESAALEIETDTRYVALSYCWGGVVPIRLLEANHAALKLGMKWNEIPLLFQEIVQLVQKLANGVRFLWIDALCIIQDSIQDWDRECTQMGKVYHNAYFTIAASLAEDSNCSILSNPRIHWHEALPIQRGKENSMLQVFVQQAPLHNMQQPLDTRLWAFQEHLMASRILRYMSDEINFECQQLVGCECEPAVHGGRDTGLGPVSLPDNLRIRWKCLPQFDTQEVTLAVHQIWKNIVEEASARALTHETDRLPAISGLASLSMSYIKPSSTYLAGLWSEDFIMGLAWQPSGPRNLLASQRPSWSWTSIQAAGGHYYPQDPTHVKSARPFKLHASLIEAGCRLKGSNPFGEVIGGFAVLEAPTRLLELEIISEDPADIGYDYSRYYAIKDLLSTNTVSRINRFHPDTEIEISPFKLAGRTTARRKRKGKEVKEATQPEVWSGLLVHLSDDIETPGSKEQSLKGSDNMQTSNSDNGSPDQDEGSSPSESTFSGAAYFLVLGLHKNRDDNNKFMNESGERESKMSFEGYCFERLGAYSITVNEASDLKILLGGMRMTRLYIE